MAWFKIPNKSLFTDKRCRNEQFRAPQFEIEIIQEKIRIAPVLTEDLTLTLSTSENPKITTKNFISLVSQG